MLETSAPQRYPSIKISPRGASRLKAGHVWVYRSDIVSANGVAPGSVVTVTDHRGKPLGTAFYSSASQIALRLISHDAVSNVSELLRQRIADAISYREAVVSDTDAYRIIFSEADSLPGIIVDRYADVLSLQILTQATDAEMVRQLLISELSSRLKPASIVERVDARIRELENLPSRVSGPIQGDKTSTIVTMNGIQFHYHALEGQKTGSFLDQRENYAAAAQYAHGDALDVFCYQGGFALHFAQRCSSVTGVDSSRPALESAERNAALNQEALGAKGIEWIEANAFDLMKDYAASDRRYDIIVLDPPAFAKTKRDLDAAMRGYKELNLRAMKMLRPGGFLISCSCSYHVSQPAFVEMLGEASSDAGRRIRLVETRGQAKDHPVLPGVPESSYLKCVIIHVSQTK
ncbi:MAG TPA: class I SAM-dependent rRNA methyltransferase [Candidatus Sulfotelmatobacter sp.]